MSRTRLVQTEEAAFYPEADEGGDPRTIQEQSLAEWEKLQEKLDQFTGSHLIRLG